MKLTNEQILCVLYTAKTKFIVDRNSHDYTYGMCFYLSNTINFVFNEYVYYNELENIIPEFTPKTFGLNVEKYSLWWNIIDTDSRIKAFDKLIEIYKNK